MKLSALLRSMDDVGVGATRIEPQEVPESREMTIEADPEITSIHYRAQEVQPGGLFVAIKGLAADGHDYVEEAIARGAAVIVLQAGKEVPSGVLTLAAADTRKALAALAAGFYGHPSRAMTVAMHLRKVSAGSSLGSNDSRERLTTSPVDWAGRPV